MRILHVIQRYWPCGGGAEKHLHELSRRLVADGHQVTVFTTNADDFAHFWNPRKSSLGRKQDIYEGVRIRRFPVRHLPAAPLLFPAVRRMMITLSSLPVGVTPLLNRLARYVPSVPGLELALQVTTGQFDLIAGMTICFESLLIPALAAARRNKIPFLIYPLTHLGESERSRFRKYYAMPHQIALSQAADGVLAQTAMERDFLTAQGVRPERIVVAGPGVNPEEVLGGDGDRFRSTHGLDGPIVFSLGTLCKDKGTLDTLAAMQGLWAAGRVAHLVLAGAVMDDFRTAFARLPASVRDRCRILGFIDDREKRDLLAAGDVFVLPSRTDSFGIVYLEAWLYTTPVIGAAAGGVQEVIQEGKTGFLIPYGDRELLAIRITQVLDDRALACRMGERGRKKVLDHHTWERVYANVKPVYEAFID
jgi:glycosyltransferase involved in cell wall biosynthesis